MPTDLTRAPRRRAPFDVVAILTLGAVLTIVVLGLAAVNHETSVRAGLEQRTAIETAER